MGSSAVTYIFLLAVFLTPSLGFAGCIIHASALDMSYLHSTALSLAKEDNLSTADAVVEWVHTNIKYKFYEDPIGVEKTLSTGTGDCTDQNMLVRVLLGQYDIRTYPLYGLCRYHRPGKMDLVARHDWSVADIVVNGSSERIILDATNHCDEYDQYGYGVWNHPWVDDQPTWEDLSFG